MYTKGNTFIVDTEECFSLFVIIIIEILGTKVGALK